jgi:HD superfamily phosphodiesterase
MDQIHKIKLIKEAQNYLINNPQDVLHDITHHYRVWVNAQSIVKEENIADVNIDILELICWWHDVDNPNITKEPNKRIVELTAEYLSKQFNGIEKEILFDSIKNHEFGSIPKFVEGKILQDADKLDLLSEDRVNWAVENLKAGVISREWLTKTAISVRDNWFPKMIERYNFNYTKQCHIDRVGEFTKFLNTIIVSLE